MIVQRVDKLVSRVGKETPQREGLLVQLQFRSLPLTVSCKYSSVRQGRSNRRSALTYEGSKLTTVNMIVYCYQVLGIELKCLQVIIISHISFLSDEKCSCQSYSDMKEVFLTWGNWDIICQVASMN